MNGYTTPYGYIGLINGDWMLFATETEYYEYFKETKYETYK